MSKILAIAALRGGVGKTTMTWNLAHQLSEMGHKVLTVDFDNQQSLTFLYEKEKTQAFDYATSSIYLSTAQDVWRNKYDYILFDTAPSLDESTAKALELADEVIVPVADGFEEILGLPELKQAIAKIKQIDLENVPVREEKLPWIKDIAQ